MNQKQLWTTIIVAVFASIISSILTVSIISSSPGLSPWFLQTSKINSNSCNADETCEVNEIKAEEQIWTDHVITLQPTENMRVTSANNIILRHGGMGAVELTGIEDSVITKRIRAETMWLTSETGLAGIAVGDDPEDPTDGDDWIIIGDDAGTITASDGIGIQSMSGAGNAYACFNSNGQFIRSNTPCA
jgi:hypothetical protein